MRKGVTANTQGLDTIGHFRSFKTCVGRCDMLVPSFSSRVEAYVSAETKVTSFQRLTEVQISSGFSFHCLCAAQTREGNGRFGKVADNETPHNNNVPKGAPGPW